MAKLPARQFHGGADRTAEGFSNNVPIKYQRPDGETGRPAYRQAGALASNQYMWYVYAIRSQIKNYIYVGLTSDINKRVQQHNKGKEKTTRPYRPFDLIHSEAFSSRAKARKREIYLKSGIGKEFLRSLNV
jgi:putative endonuclease